MSEQEREHEHNYGKVYLILLVLLVVSILGPMLEIQVITLITAFGIAGVKALLVARKFMHINEAPKFISYVMTTCLVFMMLFFAGVSPDVMESSGDNWKKNLKMWLYSPPPAHHVSHAPEGHGSGGH